MSALAMILMATMAIPGDVSEKVSGELVQEQNLNGEWEGASQGSNGELTIEKIKISRGRLYVEVKGKTTFESPLRIIKEGDGMLRWETIVAGKVEKSLGIYKQEGSRLFICLRLEGKGRPTSFVTDDLNCLLILYPAKSRK